MSVIEFLSKYWRLIAEAILVIISLVLFLLKKKPTLNEMDNILLWICENLPKLINLTETTGLPGAVKLESLLDVVRETVKKRFHVDLPESYISLVSTWIEDILSTPQKKEVSI